MITAGCNAQLQSGGGHLRLVLHNRPRTDPTVTSQPTNTYAQIGLIKAGSYHTHRQNHRPAVGWLVK